MININLPEIKDLKKYNVDDLPKEEGVYFVFGNNDELIYIGKSKNIFSRLIEHHTIETHVLTACVSNSVSVIDFIDFYRKMFELKHQRT